MVILIVVNELFSKSEKNLSHFAAGHGDLDVLTPRQDGVRPEQYNIIDTLVGWYIHLVCVNGQWTDLKADKA